ncbi:DUF2069 domain-containing protein [Dyella sp. ASV21]|jgi:uncharacterized membrane protein|uniref:DUF2069 domain-containing protein n=1 Tax=Dyella sp. ASV21 TaxID=2795114 RepID=UPI0018EB30A2|nr:DUF2069 domain-containing protein [Dyella sp. ASV21]
MTAPVARHYRVGLLAWAALTALQLAWHGWLFPAEQMPMALVLTLTVIPLLLPLLALRNVRRALLWVGILSLFYFCHGISEAWSAPGQRALAVAEIVLTLVLIGTLGLGVRRKSPA